MIEESLNNILKKMWHIDEKSKTGEDLSAEEKVFYDTHLPTIQEYYREKNKYWQNKNI